MSRVVFKIAISISLCLWFSAPVISHAVDDKINDSLPGDSLLLDTSLVPGDSVSPGLDSLMMKPDSLAWPGVAPAKMEPPLPPPIRLIDSLALYFARHGYEHDIRENDLYPRNAAGFLYHEASYYTVTYLETPLRTTVSPFGLPGNRIAVRSGMNEIAPYDRTVPADGLIDFDDIATGDVDRACIIEGPMAGYYSLTGASALLYLKPFEIPEGPARSRFVVERGSFGYAYTRGRIARMFTSRLGLAFSTDYRKGNGFSYNTDDDSYNVKTRIHYQYDRRTTIDAGLGVYRRKGGFLDYRRTRRDQQWTLMVTRQEFFGGQLTGIYNIDLSRSSDETKTIRPRDTYVETAFMLPSEGALFQVGVRFGKEQYYINQYYAARYYGFGDISGFFDAMGGCVFFFSRARDAENQDIAFEGSLGYARRLSDRWKFTVSAGYLGGWPDLTDLYLMERTWSTGENEQGNLDLAAEKKLSTNATLAYTADKLELSASLNAGRAIDMIYYDRNLDQLPDIRIIPENDDITYADINLSGSFHDLWWFYGKASATARAINSERYGDSSPYSPRWQMYGQLGLYYFVKPYQVNVRLFGDLTYTERPLSYSQYELETTAIFCWGVNASLKDFSFYYIIHNALNQLHLQPEGYGYTGWFNSWGFKWQFLD